MTLVDSSVWIDFLRGSPTPQASLLDSMLGREPVLLGDLIAAEVLQGIRTHREFKLVERTFDAFERVQICDWDIALKAARHFRTLREKGITVRKTIDALIATRCIEDRLVLLHADRDFEPFEKHLGLTVAWRAH